MNRSTHCQLAALVMGSAIFLAGLTSAEALAENIERRPFQPAEVHRVEEVGDIAISPDGEWAYV